MKKTLTIACVIFIMLTNSYSQGLPKVGLDLFVMGNLDNAFKDIAKKYQLKFFYDTALFKSITIHPQTIYRPLKNEIQIICKEQKLKYFVNDEGVIYIVDRWYDPKQELIKANKAYAGDPTKYNFTFSGKIIDTKTRESLPFVNIMVKGSKYGTASNVDGFFTLQNVPTDTTSIIFNYLGYQPKEIYLSPGVGLNDASIEMDVEAVGIEEVVISGEKQDILQVSGAQTSMIKMSPKKLKTLPNLGERDVFRSFQLMPGISAANENSSGLYVRGGTPDQVLVQYDGFTVYNVEHMFGFFSAFNSNAIKDVQLYKGGFNAKYGGRLSSVVEITGKDGNQKEFNGALDISLMTVNGFVEFPMGKKLTATFAARRSWESPIYKKIFAQFTDDNNENEGDPRGGTTTQETKSYFYDLNSKFTYRPTTKDIVTFSLYNGKDDLDNSIIPQASGGFGGPPGGGGGGGGLSLDIETVDLTQWGNTGSSVKWSRRQSNKLYVNTMVSYSNYFSLRERSTSGSISRNDEESSSISRGVNEDNDLLDLTAKIDLEYELNKNNSLSFGLQTTYNNISYQYLQNDTISVVERNSVGSTNSLYAQDKISLLDNNLIITPGLRYTYFTGTNDNYFEPRINFNYQLTDKFKLKGATGVYYQFAKRVIREDITQGSRDFWVLSDNENLPVSSSIQYIAGFSYELPNFLFDVEAFYKDLDNVTEYSLRIDDQNRSVNYSENFFTGTGIAKGIEFLAQKKVGNITGWLGYTLSQVTNNISGFGDYSYYASQDVPHEFKAVLAYKWHNWDFGANWIYTTGRPYTAPEGAYQLTLLDNTTADYINVSVKNGNRLPNYHRLDVSANYNFTLFRNSPASIGFSVFNLYNRSNVWYNEYEIVDSEVYETPVYYLGITPNISLTINIK